MLLRALKRGWSAFDKATTLEGKVAFGIFLALLLSIAAPIVNDILSDALKNYQANHTSPAEHLQLARDLCPPTSNGSVACLESEMDIALHHLEKIPPNAPQYSEATKQRSLIEALRVKIDAARQKQAEALAAEHAKQQAEHDRLTHQSIEESRDQMWRNVWGQAHDSFTCGTSTESMPIISFDYGHYWWNDDGRCAKQQQTLAQEKRREEQRAKDSDAEVSSYWPTTIRVNTDMDSFWLVNEERTCQTYPDEKGRVADVSCSVSRSHGEHNIPVKFWGGVDRNTVSDWRCRRESDEFVCRAVN
jgi:hypothetical protein